MRKKKIWVRQHHRPFPFLLGILGIWGLTVFLYHRILNAYFVSEDYEWWTWVRDLGWVDSFRLFLPLGLGGIGQPAHFRPLAGWVVWLDTVPLKMTPATFHVTSLFFHLVNIALVSLLGFHFLRKNLSAGLLAGLFFATFPFHSETVVWSVGGRYDLMMTTFYLMGLLGVSFGWLCLAAVSFFLALLCKESAVTFPLVAFGLLLISDSQSWLKTIKNHRGFFFALALVLCLFIPSLFLRVTNPYVFERSEAFALSRVFSWYLGILVVAMAVGFTIRGGRLRVEISTLRDHLGGKRLRQAPDGTWLRRLWFLLVFAGVTFLPVAYLPTQERYLYLPSAMAVLFLAGGLTMVFRRLGRSLRMVLLGLVFLIIYLNSWFLFQKNESWRRAGVLAEQIADQFSAAFKSASRDDLAYLVNMPDSINGAYVYRTHLKEAIEFKIGKEAPQLVLTPATIGINSQALITSPKSLQLKSDDGFVLFRPIADEQGRLVVKTSEYRATQLNKKTLQVDFLADDFDIQESLIYVFEEGEIRKIMEVEM